ncbi:Choline-phosphate cytidylyltransferase [Paramyrothecium foliicola]|nr:Choline-phosphate cytidylyltransferase [Paramyrothecium foliicola]
MSQRSPLILMGHSTGGLIIKDAWCRTAESASSLLSDIHRSISGLVFFGTPHNGMSVANILQGISGQPAENLVRDIEPGATYIKALKVSFSRATAGPNIVSCYELRTTPQSEFHPDGSLLRSGKSAMNASEDSACLYWANEVRLPINENHSMIAKLAKRDGSAYRNVPIDSRDQVSQIGHPTKELGMITTPEAQEVAQCFQSEQAAFGQGRTGGDARSNSNPKKSLINPTSLPVLDLYKSPGDPKVRIYVHGTWDMFHYGHVRFLESAKRAIPNAHLVVGVIGDEEIQKVSRPTILAATERSEVVRSCKYVDEVIEDCPAILLPGFLAKLRIDYFGRGEESSHAAAFDPYKFLNSQSKILIIPRTHTISSADIVSRIIRNRTLFLESSPSLV